MKRKNIRPKLIAAALCMSLLVQSFSITALAEETTEPYTEVTQTAAETEEEPESSENVLTEVTEKATEEEAEDQEQSTLPSEEDESITSDEIITTVETVTEEESETTTEEELTEEEEAMTEELSREESTLEGLIQDGALQPGVFDDFYFAQEESYDIEKVQKFLYQELKNRKAEIDVRSYHIPVADAGTVLASTINANPDLYFVKSGYGYTYDTSDDTLCTYEISYTQNNDDAFNAAVRDALSEISNDMTDMEKAVILHDYLVLNVEYDYDNYLNNTIPKESYSAYGALVNRKAVCMGYALAYQYLLQQCGITTYYVASSSMNHAWNIVKLGNDYYHIDTTWDDPVSDQQGRARHYYMLISDETWKNQKGHYDWTVYKGTYTGKIDCKCSNTQYEKAFWSDIDSPVISYQDGFIYRYGEKMLKRNALADSTETVLCQLPFENVSDEEVYCVNEIAFIYNGRIYYTMRHMVASCKTDGTDQRIHYKVDPDKEIVYGFYMHNGIAKISTGRETRVITLDNTGDIDYNSTFAKKVSLDRTEIEVGIGRSDSLKVTIVPSEASQRTVQWTSSDGSIASVDQNGCITGVAVGSCTVTAQVDGVKAECKVNVLDLNVKAPVFSIVENTVDYNEQLELTAQEGATIYYTVNGKDPTRNSTRYTKAIPITKDTVIKAFAVKKDFYDSEVVEKTYTVCSNNLEFKEDSMELTVHDEYRMEMKEIPTTRTISDVVFSSSDPDKLSVSGSMITALKAGTVTLTATVPDHKSRTVQTTCTITIQPRTYDVTFIGFGGKTVEIQRVEEGKDATIPDVNVPDGYRLTGWKGDCTNISEDRSVTAQYTPVIYKVTYHSDYGQPDTMKSYTIETATFALPDISGRTGYRFAGWYDNADCNGTPVSEVVKGTVGDREFYAKWVSERGLWMGIKGKGALQDIPQWPISAQIYTGKKIIPDDYVIYDGERELELNKDYTISISNNTNANTLTTEKELKNKPTITITGKGDYAGKITRNFKILPKSVEEEDVQVSDIYLKYNKKEQKPNPSIKYNGKTLSKGRDYTVEYPDTAENAYLNAGKYKILIKGCGNYTGVRTIYLQIVDPSAGQYLMSSVNISRIPDQTYTGSAVEFDESVPVIKNGKTVLVKGVDYELITDDSAEIGKHTLSIVGKGNYFGTRTVYYQIKGKSISSVKVSGLIPQTYCGYAIEQKPVVTDKNVILVEGKDYELAWTNNINAGTATVVVKGIHGYSGIKKATFKITPYDLNTDQGRYTVEFADGTTQCDYQKNGSKPEVIVRFVQKSDQAESTVTLTEGIDYTVKYVNNSNVVVSKAGQEPRVEVIGKNNFKNKKFLNFTLQNQDIAKTIMHVADIEENKQAGKFYSTPVIYDRTGNKLSAGTDYDNKSYVYRDENGKVLTRLDRPASGSIITLTVQGKGKYTGEISGTYRICEVNHNVSKASVGFKDNKKKIYYTGNGISIDKNDIRVRIGKVELTSDDFELIDYTNNVRKGTAQVTVRGIGKYAGTRILKFSVQAQNMHWYE